MDFMSVDVKKVGGAMRYKYAKCQLAILTNKLFMV